MVSRWRFSMKKKIFCLVLAVLMLVPMICLAGCGESDENESETKQADATTATITMFMITERHVPTDSELQALAKTYGEKSFEYKEAADVKDAYERVAAALNKMTKAKFRTQLVTYFYTEEEYAAVEALMQKQIEIAAIRKEIKSKLKSYKSEKKKEGITDPIEVESMFYADNPQYLQYRVEETESGEIVTEETIVNQYGIKELKYPELQPNQVDIVCVAGYDKYVEYVNNGWLSQLDNELAGASKAIPTYINQKFLDAAKINNKIYGIPTNREIGEYTFLLLNRELFDKYGYDVDTVTGLTSENFMEFLDDIANYHTDMTPLTGELDMNGVYYWNLEYEYVIADEPLLDPNKKYYTLEDGKYVVSSDEERQDDVTYYVVNGVKRTNDAFSIIGGAVAANADTGTFIPTVDIFENEEYVAQFRTILDIKEKDYYDADAINDEEKTFASAIVKGGAELAASYADDYYVVILEYPHTDDEALCANLIGVSSGTVSLSRSMDVVELITTNEEFRNLLQYGQELIDYKIDKETSQIVRTTGNYMMDINVTGNVFMAYPEEGEPANKWTYAKAQNLDSLYTPTSDLTIRGSSIDFSIIDEIKAMSVEYKARLDACTTVDEFDAFIAAATAEIKANEFYKKATKATAAEGDIPSLAKFYTDWYNTNHK